MRFYAVVSAATRRRILADAWLAHFEWVFLNPAQARLVLSPDLLVLEATELGNWPFEDTLSCPCWCFCTKNLCWYPPASVEAFEALLDVEILADRLLAWLWLHDVLTPCCFRGTNMTLTNGRLSFHTGASPPYLMRMSVSPVSEVGGDVALCFETPGRTLVVLADAIGHGDCAALDAALFVLGTCLILGRPIAPKWLGANSVCALDRWLSQRLAGGRFVAVAFLEFDRAHARIQLLNAGMPPLRSWLPGESSRRFTSSRPPLGVSGARAGAIQRLALASCNVWLMVSDGVDDTALCQWLDLACLPAPDFQGCRDLCRQAVETPLRKSQAADDDASQVIVCIAG